MGTSRKSFPATRIEDQLSLSDQLVELYFSLSIRERSQQFVNTANSAEILGVSQRTVQYWIEIGELPAVRVGKRYWVHAESARQIIRAQQMP